FPIWTDTPEALLHTPVRELVVTCYHGRLARHRHRRWLIHRSSEPKHAARLSAGQPVQSVITGTHYRIVDLFRRRQPGGWRAIDEENCSKNCSEIVQCLRPGDS